MLKWVILRDDGNLSIELESDIPGFLIMEAFQLNEYTEYTFEVTVWNEDKPSATSTQSVTMETKAPPKFGIVRAKPNQGFTDTEFTIQVIQYRSEYDPITYRVWASNELNDKSLEKAEELTQGSMDAVDYFEFYMLNDNPVIVEVTDTWGEIIYKEVSITLFNRGDFRNLVGEGRRLKGSFSDVYNHRLRD